MFSDCPDDRSSSRAARSPFDRRVGRRLKFPAATQCHRAPHRRVFFSTDYICHAHALPLYRGHLGRDTAQVADQPVGVQRGGRELGISPISSQGNFEHPRTVENALRGRMDLEDGTAKFGGLNLPPPRLRANRSNRHPACGTSCHAALVGEYLFRGIRHIPVKSICQRIRYGTRPLKNTSCLAITPPAKPPLHAGEPRETPAGHKVLAICNVFGSTIAREADAHLFARRAGIGGAPRKLPSQSRAARLRC